jgi:hypothetical protein
MFSSFSLLEDRDSRESSIKFGMHKRTNSFYDERKLRKSVMQFMI